MCQSGWSTASRRRAQRARLRGARWNIARASALFGAATLLLVGCSNGKKTQGDENAAQGTRGVDELAGIDTRDCQSFQECEERAVIVAGHGESYTERRDFALGLVVEAIDTQTPAAPHDAGEATDWRASLAYFKKACEIYQATTDGRLDETGAIGYGTRACLIVGLGYLRGIAVSRDRDRAVQYLTSACRGGLLAACGALPTGTVIEVAIVGGSHMLEVFGRLDAAGVCDTKDLVALARDTAFAAQQKTGGKTVEGYLFPGVYEFRVGQEPREVLETMIARHRRAWDELVERRGERAAQLRDSLGWSDHDFLILASLVEKEAVDPNERPRIAAVLVNRLTSPSFKSKKLEVESAVRYGCTVPTAKSKACMHWDQERLHAAQLGDEDNPYNTYQHAGLPPGPISNPGRTSMQAALSPVASDELYFVAMADGSHLFAATRRDHEANIKTMRESRRGRRSK